VTRTAIPQLNDLFDEDEFLTRPELMKLLKVSRTWTKDAQKNGIPFIKNRGTLRFPKRACLEWFIADDASAA
jgi:phage terminase Nu1 subunit (DNA packaging protein)